MVERSRVLVCHGGGPRFESRAWIFLLEKERRKNQIAKEVTLRPRTEDSCLVRMDGWMGAREIVRIANAQDQLCGSGHRIEPARGE